MLLLIFVSLAVKAEEPTKTPVQKEEENVDLEKVWFDPAAQKATEAAVKFIECEKCQKQYFSNKNLKSIIDISPKLEKLKEDEAKYRFVEAQDFQIKMRKHEDLGDYIEEYYDDARTFEIPEWIPKWLCAKGKVRLQPEKPKKGLLIKCPIGN